MKKFIKKIGVFGIIIAMLIPFVELPVVKAASDECTNHTLQQYLFIDRINGNSDWSQYLSSGYATYTSYTNLFPITDEGKSVEILGVEVQNDLSATGNKNSYTGTLSNFYAAFDNAITESDYSAREIGKIGSYSSQGSSSYKIENILHGYWSRESNPSKMNFANWTIANKNTDKSTKEEYFINHSMQTVFEKKSLNSSTFNANVYGAEYTGSYYRQASGYSNLKNYINDVANRVNSNLIYNDDDKEYFALRIKRSITENDLNNLVIGYVPEGGNGVNIFTTDSNLYGKDKSFTNSQLSAEKLNSFSGLRSYMENENENKVNFTYITHCSNCDENYLDINTGDEYYWPVLLTVEYQVCPTSTASGKWYLVYNGNTTDNSAKSMPDNSDETEIGTSIALSDKTPTRDGYTFKGWCIDDADCSNPLSAKTLVESPSSAGYRTAYAQWGKTGTEENKKTGVVSYVIGFISVGLIAAGIYLVAKKKNFFKQI